MGIIWRRIFFQGFVDMIDEPGTGLLMETHQFNWSTSKVGEEWWYDLVLLMVNLFGPFPKKYGLKINSKTFCQFLKATFLKQWYQKTPSFKRSIILIQGKESKYNKDWIGSKEFKCIKWWPTCSLDLNAIENLSNLLKISNGKSVVISFLTLAFFYLFYNYY